MISGKLKHRLLLCLLACTLFGIDALTQTQISLPSQSNSTQGFSHGYWFEAPDDFTISGLQTVLDAGGGPQYIQLFKINEVMPVSKAFPTSNFELLHRIYGGPFNTFNPVNIKVKEGDKIGVLGSAGIDVSLGIGPHTASIMGHSVSLQQLGSTGFVHAGPGISLLWGSGKGKPGNIGRVKVFWSETIKVPNDVGIARLDSPHSFCEGFHDVKFTLKNYGNNQVDSVKVYWSLNGSNQQTLYVYQLLDTAGGLSNHEVTINLGSLFFASGKHDTIKIWTSLPNGVADTVNYNDTITQILHPSLSGNYVINPSSASNADFNSLTEAVNELNTFGICGSVNFLVKATMYNEQISLGPIRGSGPENRVRFIKDGPGSFVFMQHSARSGDENFVVSFNGTRYVSFDGFRFMPVGSSYTTAITINDFCTNIRIDNSWLISSSSMGNVSNSLVVINGNSCDSIEIANSQFQGGTYSIYGSSSKYAPTSHTRLINNVFNNFQSCAVRLRYHHQLEVDGNVFKTFWSHSEHAFRIDFCNSYAFTGNRVKHAAFRPVQFFKCSGNLQQYSLIANNMIHSGDGTGSTNGLYIEGDFTRVVHNTIVMESAINSGLHAIHIKGGISDVLNNLIVATGGNPSIPLLKYEGLFSVTRSDYNNIFSLDSTGFGDYDMSYSNLIDWQKGTGFDIHSSQFNPGFISFDSLRHCLDSLDNTGTPLPYVSHDIDHDLRDTLSPDIGADEWIGYNGFFLGDDQYICYDSIFIGNPSHKADFMWNSGDTVSPMLVGNSGVYPVTISSQCGLIFHDTVEVIDNVPTSAFTVERSFNSWIFQNLSENADSYVWDFGDGSISTYKNPTHIYENGIFDACLTSINECDSVMHCLTISNVAIGTQELESIAFSAYPNPVGDKLFFEFENDEFTVESVQLFTVTGHVLKQFSWRTDANLLVLELNEIQSGMYVVRINSSAKSIIHRMVKR